MAPQMPPFVWFDFLDAVIAWADRHLLATILLVLVLGGAAGFALARLVGYWLRPVSVPMPPAEPLRFTPRPWGQPAPKGFAKADRTRAVADMRSRRA